MSEKLPAGKQLSVDVVGTLTAPTIYFDVVTNQGVNLGVINIGVATTKWTPQADGKMRRDIVAMADLRFPIGMARFLKEAVDNALLLATPPQSTDAPKEQTEQAKTSKTN